MESNNSEIYNEALFQIIIKGSLSEFKNHFNQDTNIEARNKYQNTPLYEAIYHDRVDITSYLIERKANLHAICHEGKTPLLIAAIRSKPEILELFPLDKIDPYCKTNNAETPLILACRYGSISNAMWLLNRGDNIDACDAYGRTALHHAAIHDAVNVIMLLLERGADKEVKDSFDRTPLHVAAQHNSISAVKFLLVMGANIEAKDNKGRTALHLSAREGAIGAFEALTYKGADQIVKDNENNTPNDVARNHEGYIKYKDKEEKRKKKQNKKSKEPIENSTCTSKLQKVIQSKNFFETQQGQLIAWARTRNHTGESLCEKKSYEAAAAKFDDSLFLIKLAKGNGANDDLATIQYNYALSCLKVGRYNRANRLMKGAYENRLKLFKEHDTRTIEANERLAEISKINKEFKKNKL